MPRTVALDFLPREESLCVTKTHRAWSLKSWVLFCVLFAAGCQQRFHNRPLDRYDPSSGYRFETIERGKNNTDDTFVFLAFSGGGTRAAAFAYGVLLGLSELDNPAIEGASLLEEVDIISSVSGGSFTSLAYGLWHEELFKDDRFKREFFYHNVQGALFWEVLNPLNMIALPFPGLDGIDVAANYYNKQIFRGHTYQDLHQKGRPYIIANATDVARQSTFSFVQAYFDLLGSDLLSVPVASAAAASSAFPVLLPPMRLQYHVNEPMKQAVQAAVANKRRSRLPMQEAWAESLLENPDRTGDEPVEIDPKKYRYLYVLDGGISDNLGLHAFIDALSNRGIRDLVNQGKIKRLLVVIVDAGKPPHKDIERKQSAPGRLSSGFTAATGGIYNNSLLMTGLLQYNLLEALPALRNIHHACTAKCPNADLPKPPPMAMTEFYVANISFGNIARERQKDFVDIKTSFALPEEQVDDLIEEGRRQIKNDPQIRKLLNDLGD
jgi:hypothetical protein